jgi:hypothetical protein
MHNDVYPQPFPIYIESRVSLHLSQPARAPDAQGALVPTLAEFGPLLLPYWQHAPDSMETAV